MELDEREFIRRNARLVEEWENTPRKPDDLYSDMTREEVIRLSMYQQELLASREQENKDLHDKLDSVLAQLTETNATLACLTRMLADKDSEIKALMESKQESDSLIQALTEQLKRGYKDRFGSKSQKGSASAKAKKEERSHQQDKDDFDGTSGSIGGSGNQTSSSTSSEPASKTRTENQLTADMLRRGSSYRHSKADNKVTHRSNLSKLPAGAIIIKITRQYACEISGDEDARYIPSLFAQLYAQEDTFKKAGLTPEQIRQARRLPGYLDIIGQLRSKLETLTADVHPPRGELMEKAIRYLDTFWKQLFRYLDDGRYSIDNNIAERNIRPLAGERKNSLFFGSHKMARASAIYHTAIATCRMTGVSVMEYFKTFFRRIIEGARDYSLLMPHTI